MPTAKLTSRKYLGSPYAFTLRRVLAGSVPPASEELWEWARKNKYQTDLLKRVESDDGSIGEQGVDEILHLKIANVLIDHPHTDTLVVATGDGSVSEFGTGFIPQIERAMKLGWRIEVWSRPKTLSRKYLTLSKNWQKQVKLIALDPFYHSVTFVQPGHYYRIAKGKREEFDLDGRTASCAGSLAIVWQVTAKLPLPSYTSKWGEFPRQRRTLGLGASRKTPYNTARFAKCASRFQERLSNVNRSTGCVSAVCASAELCARFRSISFPKPSLKTM